MTRDLFSAGLMLGVVLAAGCAAAPRGRPIPTSGIETGADTLSSARQQFEGNWTLVSFTVTNPAGRQSSIDATGTLTTDAFGEMRVEYRLSEEGLRQMIALGFPSRDKVLSTSGRVTIDPQQNRVRYIGEGSTATGYDADLAERRANPVGLERTRYYTFTADGTLSLDTRYDDGKIASKTVWKKAP